MVSAEEVISYIYNNLRSGYSITQVEQELLNEGMSKEQIEQYIEYVMDTYYQHDTGVIQNAKHHSPNIKWFFGIFGVLIIIIILSSIFIFSGEDKVTLDYPSSEEYDPGPSNIPDSKNKNDTITNDTTNGNNYGDEEVGTALNMEVNGTVNTTINMASENGNVSINLTENTTSKNLTNQNAGSVDGSNESESEIQEDQLDIVLSGEFESYERYPGDDVFNIEEPRTINYNDESYIVTLKGLNSDSKSYILDINGIEKTFRYGLYQEENNLPVFADYFIVDEPYAYVKLIFPKEGKFPLVSNIENIYKFKDKIYSFKIVDEYELDKTITLEVDSSSRVIEVGSRVLIEELSISFDSLEFDDFAIAHAMLSMKDVENVSGNITLNFDEDDVSQTLEPYGATFSIDVIDINESNVTFSILESETYFVNEKDLFNTNNFTLNNLEYLIDSINSSDAENWTLEVKLKYS